MIDSTQSASQTLKTLRTVFALMLREMSSTYGRSVAGYLWAFAEPVGGILLLTVVFSFALRAPGLGDSFALYYASGFLPFTTFMDISRKTSASIKYSKRLLFYPQVTFFDALVARVALNSLTHIAVSSILFALIIPDSRSHIFLNIPELALAYVMAISLAFGVGSLNCYLFWRFPAWEQVWGVLTRPLFIVSAIFYNFETIPTNLQWYLWFNPLVHVVGQARDGVYAIYQPSYVSLTFVFGLSASMALTGYLLVWRNNKEIINT